MSENDDGGNSRSERLRQRRGARQQQSESAETDDPSEPSQSSEPDEAGDRSETANTSKLSKTDEPSKTSEADKLSVKEEQVGTYMYLPQSQKKEIERLYNVLKAEYEYEFDEEFEKNRAFYPLLVQYGLESLDGLDASEIQERLESI